MAWTNEHTMIAIKQLHKADGCKFTPWFENDKFIYAICYKCNKKITPEQWEKQKEANDAR